VASHVTPREVITNYRADFFTARFPSHARISHEKNEQVSAILMATIGHVGEFDVAIFFTAPTLTESRR
jgi:hypothetical protein